MSLPSDLDLKPKREPKQELEPEHQQEQQRQQAKVGKDIESRRVENRSISKDALIGAGRKKVSKQPDQGGGVAPETVPPLPAKVNPDVQLRLNERLALRPKEAAAALGISERKFRQISPKLPAVWFDRMKLYPVDSLRKWLNEEAERQHAASDQTAEVILRELSGGRR